MKNYFLKAVIFITLLNFLCADYTADILRKETGARALGMGGAYTSIADDTSALFYNPAGLGRSGFQFSYMEDDTSHVAGIKSGVEDAIKLGNFAYSRRKYIDDNLNFVEIHSYGFGVRTQTGIDYGLVFKRLVQENPSETGNGWAADIGTIVNFTPDFKLGVNAQDFSAGNTGTKPSYRIGVSKKNGAFLFAYDHETFNTYDKPNAPQGHFGVEWNLTDGFALRGGFNDKHPTYGLSVGILGLLFDYATEQDDREVVYRFCAKLGNERYPEVREYGLFKNKEFLAIDLNDSLIAGQSEYSIFGGTNTGADYVLDKIRLAADDKDIAGIIIKLDDISNGLSYVAIMQELRAELQHFKSKGKYIIVYIQDQLSPNTYYLASVADKIVMPKMGAIVAIGKSLTVTRYKGLLEKIGLDYQIIKSGEYKDALNPYSEGFTEAQRQHIEALVTDLNDQTIQDIRASRQITDYDFGEIKDGGIISAEQALKYKLIDEIGYYEKATEMMKTVADLKYAPEIIKMGDLPAYEVDVSILPDFNTIAVVDIDGELIDGKSQTNFLFGGKAAGAETICEELKKIGEADEVKAVVVRINSPGGSPIAADKIYLKLKELKDKGKFIVISMGNIAASGGYYIAAAGDVIVANPGTLTGSIGVIGGVWKAKKLYEYLNIKEETVKTGEHLDMDALGRDLTDTEKQMLVKYQDEVYQQFKLVVSTGRNLHLDEVEQRAQGKIYTGKRAQELKLVDKLGTFYDAIDAAKEGAHITGKARIIHVIKMDEDWFAVRSKASALLGLDQLNFKSMFKQDLVEFKSYIY